MNIEPAVMQSRDVSHRMMREYRQSIEDKRATKDDVAIYRGLRAVLRGQKVIDINLAMGLGGLDAQGHPRFAIVRANAPRTYLRRHGSFYRFSSKSSDWDGRVKHAHIDVAAVHFGSRPLGAPHFWDMQNDEAQTPSIPPQHRPSGNLADYHILYEAEWRKVPPVDPFLLKRIDGPFFLVLAAWNLSPLEQAILRTKLI